MSRILTRLFGSFRMFCTSMLYTSGIQEIYTSIECSYQNLPRPMLLIVSGRFGSRGLGPGLKIHRGRAQTFLPGPQKYVEEWPFRLFLLALGYYSTYFWGPGRPPRHPELAKNQRAHEPAFWPHAKFKAKGLTEFLFRISGFSGSQGYASDHRSQNPRDLESTWMLFGDLVSRLGSWPYGASPMACYLGLYGILLGLTKSNDHPSRASKASFREPHLEHWNWSAPTGRILGTPWTVPRLSCWTC